MDCFYIIMLISCLCLGIRIISDTGKLFEPLKNWLGLLLPMWLWMPLIGCVTCMASLWGTVVFWIVEFNTESLIDGFTFFRWGICCLTAAFFNELGWSIVVMIREAISVLAKQNTQKD